MINNRPLVSVVMPAYNCEKYISDAVDSVIDQTVSDWEIQIVDDCSTDNTYETLKPYLESNNRIYYYCLKKNSGPQVARTEAIRRAQGKYIAFLDSDDIWDPQKLEKQVDFMECNKINFSCTAFEQMDECGKKKNTAFFPPPKCDYKKMLQLSNPIGNTTVMYNQEVLGKYEVPNIKKRNDFALWLKILRDAEYCYGLQEILAFYRVRSNSVSSNKLAQAKYHWQLYYNVEKLGVLRSLYYMLCWGYVKGTGRGLDKRSI